MRSRSAILVGAVLLTLWPAGCSSTSNVVAFLGAERTSILEDPDKVESFRIDGSPGARDGAEGQRLAGYPVIGRGPDLDADQISEIQRLVFDAANWNFEMAKACEFMPGGVLRFHRDQRDLAVLLCFSCDEWGFHLDGETRTEDFDPARRHLLALSRQLFPDDEVLHELK